MKLFLLFLLTASFCFAQTKPVQVDKIMDHVFYKLADTGTITQDRFGYVYLKVDDKYITDLVDYIKEEGFEDPGHAYGPHITIMFGDEIGRWINEAGTSATFTITGCEIVPSNKDGIESYCVLKATSSDLSKLRKSYKLKNLAHSFHITIGKKMKAAEEDEAA